jgi:hypothetical protein
MAFRTARRGTYNPPFCVNELLTCFPHLVLSSSECISFAILLVAYIAYPICCVPKARNSKKWLHSIQVQPNNGYQFDVYPERVRSHLLP